VWDERRQHPGTLFSASILSIIRVAISNIDVSLWFDTSDHTTLLMMSQDIEFRGSTEQQSWHARCPATALADPQQDSRFVQLGVDLFRPSPTWSVLVFGVSCQSIF
jgi:hypothetical protein